MNKAFRTLRCKITGKTVVAHERSKSHSGLNLKRSIVGLAVAAALAGTLIPTDVFANGSLTHNNENINTYYSDGANFSLDYSHEALNQYTTRAELNSNVITVNQDVTHTDASTDYPAFRIANSVYKNKYATDGQNLITQINRNTITNNGSLTGVGEFGFSIQSYVVNNVDLATFATADVSGNTVVNKGSISGSGYGFDDIGTKYSSLGSAASLRAVSISRYLGRSTARVDFNNITNSGDISNPETGAGLSLLSIAYGSLDTSGNVFDGILDNKYLTSSNHNSQASVSGNTITNSGSILSSVSGISLTGIAASSGDAYADVSGNTITITSQGSISSENASAVLITAYSVGSSARSSIQGNTISNQGILEGVIGSQAVSFGPRTYSYTTGNTITNSGRIETQSDSAIVLLNASWSVLVDASGNNGYGNVSKSFVNENRITNTGTLTTNVDGSGSSFIGKYGGAVISLWSSSLSLGRAYSQVDSNDIINTGPVTAGYNAGISLTSLGISRKYTLSSVSGNSISNSGALLSNADPSGNSLIGLGSLAAAKYQTKSEVNSNIITNSGSLSGGGGIGITSVATTKYINVSDASGIDDINAYADVSGNQISNTGSISSENGIQITAQALIDGGVRLYSSLDSSGNLYIPGGFTYSEAKTYVANNIIGNSGSISASSKGIELYGESSVTEAQFAYVATYVKGNRITNSGTILDQYGGGIILSAAGTTQFTPTNDFSVTEGYFGETFQRAFANTQDNTIINSGTITAYMTGIGLLAYGTAGSEVTHDILVITEDVTETPFSMSLSSDATVSGNSITNSGTIRTTATPTGQYYQPTRGIFLSSETNITNDSDALFDASGTPAESVMPSYLLANSTLNDNTISNTGSITSGTGIELRAYTELLNKLEISMLNADSSLHVIEPRLQNHSVSDVKYNSITNSGSISATYGHGIALTANTKSTFVTTLTVDNIAPATPYVPASYDASGVLISDGSGIGGTLFIAGINSIYVRNNTITNSGTITASGNGIYIDAGSDSEGFRTFLVQNSNASEYKSLTDGSGVNLILDDTLDSSGNSQYGSIITSGNTITNSGVINAGGSGIKLAAAYNSYYIFGDSDVSGNTIFNSGTINASYQGIVVYHFGINASTHNNTITNTGTIRSVGTGISIKSGDILDNNTINNSGLLVSSGDSPYSPYGAVAIWVSGSADASGSNFNTLNLSAPAFIGGKIQLQEAANFNVNLTSGLSHSVNWTFDQTGGFNPLSISTLNPGSTPWFSNATNKNYATIDPSAFAAASNILADTANLVSSMNKFGLERGMKSEKTNSWLAVQANAFDYDGDGVATQKQKSRLYGIGAGFSQQYSADTVLGVMLGYNRNDLSVNGRFAQSFKNETNGAFVGVFGSTRFNPLVIDYALNGGYMDHKDRRFVNDNLASSGIAFADASYTSAWLAPELKVSLPYQIAGGLTAAPNVSLRYASQWIDGYTESGSNANANIDSRTIGSTEGRVGLKLSKDMERGRISAHIDYLRRQSTGDDKVRVSMIGDTHDVSFYTRDLNAAVVGADVRFNITKEFVLDAAGSYMVGDHVSGGNATASLRYLF